MPIDNNELLVLIDQIVEAQDQTIRRLEDNFNHRLQAMSEQIAQQEILIRNLMLEPAVAGTFPAVAEIQNMQVQIWHRPDLTSKEKMGGRTPWSLKFEYWHRERKQPVVNVALLPKDKLLRVLTTVDAPASYRDFANDMSPGMLGGVVRHKAIVAGRPYKADQIAFISGHEISMEEVVVVLLVADQQIRFDNFGLAGGESKTSAKWFSRWTKPCEVYDLKAA